MSTLELDAERQRLLARPQPKTWAELYSQNVELVLFDRACRKHRREEAAEITLTAETLCA
jgi:hypothetical protein